MEEEIQAWIREDDPPQAPGILHRMLLAAGVSGEVLGPLLACVALWPPASRMAIQLVRGDEPDAAQLLETSVPAGVIAVLGLMGLMVAVAWGVRALLDHLGTDHGAAELSRAQLAAGARRVRPGEDGVGVLLAGDGSLASGPLRTPLTWLVILAVTGAVTLPALGASGAFLTEFLGMASLLWLLPVLAILALTTTRLTPLAALLIGTVGSLGVYAFGGMAGLGWVRVGPELLLAGLPFLVALPAVVAPLLGVPAIRIGPGGLQGVVLRGGRVVPREDAWVPSRIRLVPGPRGPAWEAHDEEGRRTRYHPIDGEATVLQGALDEVGLRVSVVGIGRRTRLGDELGEASWVRLWLPLAAALGLGLAAGEWGRRQAVLATEVAPLFGGASDLWDLHGVDLDGPARALQRGLDGVAVRDAIALAQLARGEVQRAREAVDHGLTLARALPVWGEGSATWAEATREGLGPRSLLSELTLLAHLDLELAPWRRYQAAPVRPGEPRSASARATLRAALFALDPDQAVGGVRAVSRATAAQLGEALARDPAFWQARATLTLRDLAAPFLLLDRPRPGGTLGPGAGAAAAEGLLSRTRRAARRRRLRSEPLARQPGWEDLASLDRADLPASIAREVWGALVRARLKGLDLAPWRGVARGLAGTWALHGSAGPRKKLMYPDGTVSFHRAQALEVLRTALMEEAGFPESFEDFLGRLEEPAAWRQPIPVGPFVADDWVSDASRFWAASRRAGLRPADIPADVRPESLPEAAQRAGFGQR
jgi:hypothetical protein